MMSGGGENQYHDYITQSGSFQDNASCFTKILLTTAGTSNRTKGQIMDYAELHCHSYYSFHDGASALEELLVQAKELGYRALAITDHDNLCGAMRFAQPSGSFSC